MTTLKRLYAEQGQSPWPVHAGQEIVGTLAAHRCEDAQIRTAVFARWRG